METETDHLKARGLEAQTSGLPSIQMDEMAGIRIPGDWEIDSVLGDIIMAKYVDQNDKGEVQRDGIWIPLEMNNKTWRVAQVVKTGPSCLSHVKVGDLIQFPSDKGIPMISFRGEKFIFLNETRIFAIVKRTKVEDKK